MTFAVHEDVELVEFAPSDEATQGSIKPRRRRKRGRKQNKRSDQPLMSAAEILSRAAHQNIESSPSSVISEPCGRKLSSLELDQIVETDEVVCTTGTPGSLDSSRSLWELGTVADEDMDLLFNSSSRSESQPSCVSDITANIDALLSAIPRNLSNSSADLKRLCIPSRPIDQRNRLCIGNAPKVDLSPLTEFFGSVSSSLSQVVEQIAGVVAESSWGQPEKLKRVMGSLSKGIPNSSIPLVNRRQRRAVEFSQTEP
jgi:hypothetical protein